MKILTRIFFVLFTLCFFNISNAQNEQEIIINKKKSGGVYLNSRVDRKAELTTLKYESVDKFYQLNSQYKVSKRRHKEKSVVFKLYIDENGKVYKYTVLSSKNKKYKDEVIRLISIMPYWQPALKDNKKVKVSLIQELNFL